MLRVWPGMDSRDCHVGLLARTSEALGRRVVAAGRGGASDASHFAAAIPLTVDGLGPRGGGAHAPHEYVLRDSLQIPRRGRGRDGACLASWLSTRSDGLAGRGARSSASGTSCSTSRAWPQWWKGVTDARELERGDPDGVGKVFTISWRSFLPV